MSRARRLSGQAKVITVAGVFMALISACSHDDAGPESVTAEEGQLNGETRADRVDGGTESDSGGIPDIPAEVGDLHPEDAFVEEELPDDEPEPPESAVQVLCNLNSTYLAELADLGMSDDGADMALVALALNDDIQVWESLVGHYPETRSDLERAREIHNYWREAIAHEEAGDGAAAQEMYRSADAAIAQLADPEAAEELGC